MLDVAVTGLRPRRRNAQHHDLRPARRQRNRRRNHLAQTAPYPSPRGPTERSRSPYRAQPSPAETPPARTPEPYSAPPARSEYAPAAPRQLLRDHLVEQLVRDHPDVLRSRQRQQTTPPSAESSSARHRAPAPASPASAGCEAKNVSRFRPQESPERTSAPLYCPHSA